MRRFSQVLSLAVMALVPGCKRVEYIYVNVCDADVVDMSDAAFDAAVDAIPDVAPDALACVRSGDLASSLLQVDGGGSPSPQMAVDGFGAAAAYPSGGGGILVRFDAAGQRRIADLALPSSPIAFAFDGVGYWVVEHVTTNVQLRSVSATGVLGTPIPIGTGGGVPGALAAHPSGDLAMLWVSASDGSLRATVVPATGSPVETVLDARPFVITVQVVGSVTALGGTGAEFIATFERFNGAGTAAGVSVQPLAPTGTAQAIAAGGATDPTRASVTPGATVGTAVVTWREGNDVHASIVDATGATVLADTIALTATGLTRVGGHSRAGGGFEVLVDHAFSASDRALEHSAFDATGAQVGATRRIATICANSYSEDHLPFVRNTSVSYSTWYDMSLSSSVAATF